MYTFCTYSFLCIKCIDNLLYTMNQMKRNYSFVTEDTEELCFANLVVGNDLVCLLPIDTYVFRSCNR